jgi:hypothetical protein
MNPLPLAEFIKVAKMHGLSEAAAVELYRIWGGSARSLAKGKQRQSEQDLRKSVSGPAALQMVNLSLVDYRAGYSHTLVHIRVGALSYLCCLRSC